MFDYFNVLYLVVEKDILVTLKTHASMEVNF